MGQLAEEIGRLCQQYGECYVEVGRREECSRMREELVRKYEIARERMDISEPELLLALMDAYEVTRDEVMLQEVLDVVSGNMEQLEVSADSVKLLSYCYYYVEEEECLKKAEEILLKLKKEGKEIEEVKLADQIFREYMGN